MAPFHRVDILFTGDVRHVVCERACAQPLKDICDVCGQPFMCGGALSHGYNVEDERVDVHPECVTDADRHD